MALIRFLRVAGACAIAASALALVADALSLAGVAETLQAVFAVSALLLLLVGVAGAYWRQRLERPGRLGAIGAGGILVGAVTIPILLGLAIFPVAMTIFGIELWLGRVLPRAGAALVGAAFPVGLVLGISSVPRAAEVAAVLLSAGWAWTGRALWSTGR
jgi:hypothetical protein